jgi:hypothetical protein
VSARTTPRATDAERASAEQRLYARLLVWGARLGTVVLLAGFVAYLTGLLPAYVPLARLPALWQLPADEFLAATGTPPGWSWLLRLGHGEFASLAGIGVLAGCSLFCLAAIARAYLRAGDRVYAGISLAIVAVMLVAASGVLNWLH